MRASTPSESPSISPDWRDKRTGGETAESISAMSADEMRDMVCCCLKQAETRDLDLKSTLAVCVVPVGCFSLEPMLFINKTVDRVVVAFVCRCRVVVWYVVGVLFSIFHFLNSISIFRKKGGGRRAEGKPEKEKEKEKRKGRSATLPHLDAP
jgi:hypothetical protein